MKAIIELNRKGSIFAAVAQQIAGARNGRSPDYRLNFESARSLFADLTPARLDLLDTLRRAGPSKRVRSGKSSRAELFQRSHRCVASGSAGPD